MKRKRHSIRRIEYSEVEYISDVYDGQTMDTKVIVNGQFMCCIAGNTIDEFHGLLTDLINAYKI